MAVRKNPVGPRRPSGSDPSNMAQGTGVVATPTLVTATVHVAFNVDVNIEGVPPITVQGVAPISCDVIDSQHIVLHYTAAPVVTNVCVVPDKCDGIRSKNGGYVAHATATF